MMLRTPPRGSAPPPRPVQMIPPPMVSTTLSSASTSTAAAPVSVATTATVPIAAAAPIPPVAPREVEPTPAPVAEPELKQSVRMSRMLQTIKKALDMSVGGASTVNLRAYFEAECRDDPEMLQQLFALPTRAKTHQPPPTIEQQEQYAGELSAQSLQTLRQRIEGAFQELCAKHDVNGQLTVLEETIDAAHKARIHEMASKEVEVSKRKELDEVEAGSRVSPEELIRAERIRVMEAEKKQLEALVSQLQLKKDEQQTRLEIKREMAATMIHDLHLVTQHMHDATALAQDYSRPL